MLASVPLAGGAIEDGDLASMHYTSFDRFGGAGSCHDGAAALRADNCDYELGGYGSSRVRETCPVGRSGRACRATGL